MKQLEFVRPAAIEIDGLFITDHNRSPLQISNERIVNDFRTQFGTTRRFYKADKREFSVSWDMIPQSFEYTVDGNLGAEDMQDVFKEKFGKVDLRVYYDFGDELQVNALITEFSFELIKRWDQYRFYNGSLRMTEI